MSKNEEIGPTPEEVDEAYQVNRLIDEGKITTKQASEAPVYRKADDLALFSEKVQKRSESKARGDYASADQIKRDLDLWFDIDLQDKGNDQTDWNFKKNPLPIFQGDKNRWIESSSDFEEIEFSLAAKSAKEKGQLKSHEGWMGVGIVGYTLEDLGKYTKWMSENLKNGTMVIADIPAHTANHEAELGSERSRGMFAGALRRFRKESKFLEAMGAGEKLASKVQELIEQQGIKNVNVVRWSNLDKEMSAHINEVSGRFRKFRDQNPWVEEDLWSVAQRFKPARKAIAESKNIEDKDFRRKAANTYVLDELSLTIALARGRSIVKVGPPHEKAYDKLTQKIFSDKRYQTLVQSLLQGYTRRSLPANQYLGFIYLKPRQKG